MTPAVLSRNFELGYLDTRETFGFLDGIHYYLPVKDYQHLLAFFDNGVLPGLEQAALLYEMPRDRVYSAEEFLHSLSLCREKAAGQYATERKKIDADSILASVRKGSLNRLKHMPSAVRLALLMELMSDVKKNGSKWSIPLRFFRDVDQAADALLHLEK